MVLAGIFRSIRTKFILGALAAIAGSGIISYISFSRAAEQHSVESLQANAIGLAEGTAFMVAPLIAFESINEMNKILEGLTRNPDFSYALISDNNHKLIASNGADTLLHHGVEVGTQVFIPRWTDACGCAGHGQRRELGLSPPWDLARSHERGPQQDSRCFTGHDTLT